MSTTAIVVFVVWLLGLVLSFSYEPIFALLSYLWIFYNDPTTSWWGRDLPDLRYSLFAAVVALLAAARLPAQPGMSWFNSGASKLLALFAIWIWLQLFWAINVPIHMDGVVLCTKYLILSYVVFRLTGTEKNLELFLWAHVGGCFLLGLRAHSMNVGGRLETVGAPGVDDSNLLAAHLVTGLVIAGFLFIGTRGWRKWLAFLALPYILNAIVLTQSRGGFLALIAAGLSAWYLAPKAHKRFVAVAGVLGVVLLMMLSNQGFWERVSTIAGPENETKNETRVQILGPQFRMFLDYPLGTGYRGNVLLSPKYMPPELLSNSGVRAAHNTFVAALVDEGVPGALILIGLYGWGFLTLYRLRKLDRRGLPARLGIYRAGIGGALSGCFVAGLFLNMLTTEVQIWLLSLLYSLTGLCQTALAKEAGASAPGANPRAGQARSRRLPPPALPAADGPMEEAKQLKSP
jgi:O-antigen ligase